MLYALVALAMVVIYKSSKVINFAQPQMIVIGAFLPWCFLAQLHFPLWVAIILGIALSGLLGVLVQRFALQQLTGQPLLSIIVATIALSVVLEGLYEALWGSTPRAYPASIPTGVITLSGIFINIQYIWSFFIALAIFGFLLLFFQCTRTGLQMRAVSEGHDIARSTGIGVSRTLISVWLIAGVLAGATGFLLGTVYDVRVGLMDVAFKGLAVLLLGGLESITGCIVGGLIIGVSEQIAVGYLDPLVGGGLSDVFPYIVMLIFILFKPFGLFGEERIERI
jgi:branched-chain amino acid transport system permease protein